MSDEQLRYEEEKHQYEEEKHQYEEEKHQYEEETLESMYVKVVSVALDCDPIPAKDRADGKLEPPWEVFARVKRERDIWIAEAERWRKNTDLYHTVLGQRDRLAEALREIANEDYRGFRPQSAIIAHKALSAMKGGSDDN
jgi:hypothetical protein